LRLLQNHKTQERIRAMLETGKPLRIRGREEIACCRGASHAPSGSPSRVGRGLGGGQMVKEAVIVAGVRTAVGKAPRGTLRATRPDDMAAAALAEVVRRAEGLDPAEIEDVVLGCAIPEGEQGMNVARIAAIRAGLP